MNQAFIFTIMEQSNAIEALAALAQATRLDIFRLLMQKGPGGISAGDIGTHMQLRAPTLSFHLNILRHAGLIGSQRQGRNIYYFARYDAVSRLMSFLLENCCQGHPEACTFLAGPGVTSHRKKASAC